MQAESPKTELTAIRRRALRERAARHARRRRDEAVCQQLLRAQSLLCVLLLGTAFFCRLLLPTVFERVQSVCRPLLEQSVPLPPLERFALTLPFLAVEAAEPTAPQGCTLAAFAPQSALHFPLEEGSGWSLSSRYGWRRSPFTGSAQFHRGVDLACAEGTLVRSAAAGQVQTAAYSPDYGNHLQLIHPGGVQTLYAHLQRLFVRSGEVVSAGQPLGRVGRSGKATGPHLHFESLSDGLRCDPSAALRLG